MTPPDTLSGVAGAVRRDPARLTACALVLLAVLFVAVNVLAAFTLTSQRVDLTADRLYSLSPATQKVLDAIEEPVTLRLDRKSVVEGKRVSVRVGLGGRRIIQKTKDTTNE